MSWQDVALESLEAAQSLRKFPRSCVSRAYYAAYAAVTQALVDSKGVAFAEGREGPNHSDVPDLIGNHLITVLDRKRIRGVKAAIRRLYSARIDADYFESISCESQDAINALVDASWIVRELQPVERGR